jgi:hypothetical protein
MNCPHCSHPLDLIFCPSCGQAKAVQRINGRYLIDELGKLIQYERGILFTIRELSLRPGPAVRSYLKENRSKLVKPVFFILVTSLLYSFFNEQFQVEEQIKVLLPKTNLTRDTLFNWVQANYGYSNLIMGFFTAFWTRLFFKKYGYNYVEILVLLCYVSGIAMLIYALFGIVQGLSGNLEIMLFSSLTVFFYISWAVAQFFDAKKISSYLKSFLAFILGMVSFTTGIFLLGAFLDSLKV